METNEQTNGVNNSSALGDISVLTPSQRREQERLRKEQEEKEAARKKKREEAKLAKERQKQAKKPFYIIMMIFKHIPLVILVPFRCIGAMSLELYLIHEFVFKIVKIATINSLSNMGRLIVGIILSLLLAFLCKLATSKITILKDKRWNS